MKIVAIALKVAIASIFQIIINATVQQENQMKIVVIVLELQIIFVIAVNVPHWVIDVTAVS
jgi:hypothetical protein